MPNMLANAAQWLAGQLQASASVPIVYRRGVNSVGVQATLGSQLLSVSDGHGNTKVERTDRDFLIAAALLVLAGQLVTPQRGDRVELTIGGTTWLYDVAAPGREPAWRWSDPHQTILRVHGKLAGMQ